MATDPNDVFHYTDSNGFLAITKTKTMWASCIECLNDEREFRHCLDLAGQIAQSFNRLEYLNAPRRIESFVDVLGRLWGMYIFSCSFSAQGDLLSQWRGYCGTGNGYNIALNLEKLKTFCQQHGYMLRPCVYEKVDQENLLRPIVQRLFEGGFDDMSIESLDERIIKASDSAAYTVREQAPFLKDYAFREEEEWRLVAYVNSHEDPRWKARPGKTSLVPYIEIDFSSAVEMISHVTVGPGPFNRDKLGFITKQHMLKSGLDINVNAKISTVPYRYW
jgi:hypothetical protein